MVKSLLNYQCMPSATHCFQFELLQLRHTYCSEIESLDISTQTQWHHLSQWSQHTQLIVLLLLILLPFIIMGIAFKHLLHLSADS